MKAFYHFWRRAVIHFYEVNGSTRAAALAYTTLLSAVPLTVVSLSTLTAFPVFEAYATKLQDFLFSNFVAAAADTIQSHLRDFALKAAGLSAISVLFLLIAAVMLIFTMENALNAIWKIRTRRQGVTAFMMYWAVLTLLPIIGLGTIAMSVYVLSLPYIKDAADVLTQWIPVFEALPFVLEWLGLSMLYTTLPNTKVLFRNASLGALVGALLFEGLKLGFGSYVSNFSSYEFVYGALSAIPIFLIWIYCCWLIILFGAVVSYVMQTKPLEPKGPDKP